MTLAELTNFIFTAVILYGAIGLCMFVLAGNELMEIFSRDAVNYMLYWPIILRDALSGYTPSF